MQPLLYSPASADSDEVVSAYAFSATLAIQDITGDAHSGVTASHLAKRLEGSAESEALLFALTSRQTPRPLGSRGYPLISVDDLTDIDAWVFISLPLLEDTSIIEATVTLDAVVAPVPGSGEPVPREPWGAALSLIDALSHSLNRPTRHIWETHPPGSPSPAAEILTTAGYSEAYAEKQATFTIGEYPAAGSRVRAALSGELAAGGEPAGVAQGAESAVSTEAGQGAFADLPVKTIIAVHNMNFDRADLPQFRALLTAASQDYPRGDLVLDTVEWTEQRLRDAGARLMDRGGNQITMIAFTDRASSGDESSARCGDEPSASSERVRKAIGLAEAVHYDSDDDSLMELGLVYVLPEYRNAGVGTALVESALEAAKSQWLGVGTGYSSYPSRSDAADAIVNKYGAETISATTAWQKNG